MMSTGQSPTVERISAAVIRLTGDWTLEHYNRMNDVVRSGGPVSVGMCLDCSAVTQLDTAGVQALIALIPDAVPEALEGRVSGLSTARLSLVRAVVAAMQTSGTATSSPRPGVAAELLARIGASVSRILRHGWLLMGFCGQVIERFARNAFHPKAWRWTSIVAQIEQIALDAVPIVVLLTFMVGAVIAFLGVTVLSDFGASVYAIDLVGFSFLREFGALLAAILMAGRTASAYAAQLGAMKINEEIDAILALGLDPLELLVVPRVIAMLVGLPLLTFIAMVSGIFGGALVCITRLGISPRTFLATMHSDIAVQHFIVGIAKTPFFAFAIACIGCLQGLTVGSSADSVGAHTTASVVHSIFVVILLDAVAALFYMEMGW